MPGADVPVVEKNFAGYSGKANRGGGVLQYFDLTKVDPMGFAFFHTKNIGADFTDQELMAKYVSMNNKMVERLDSWGVKMPKKEDGTYNKMQTGPMTEMICIDLDVTLNVRRRAERLGVRFMATDFDREFGVFLNKMKYAKEKARYIIDQGFPVIENFYSDSLTDTPMAEIADHAFLVTKHKLSPWPEK
jgi:hypothetical protein